MPKLTAKLIENLKEYGKYDDGDGLRLVIRKSGKAWVLRYQLAGKRKEIGLGPYPHYGLKEARSRADTHRALIRKGIDPLTHKADALQQAEDARVAREMNLENTFHACAVDYIEAHRAGWKNAKHAQQWVNTLTTYAFPFIGEKPVDKIETDDILKILNPIWTAKPETAARVRNRLELVLDAAKARGLRTGENSARWRGHLDKLLPRRRLTDRGNHPALPWEQLPAFMAELEHSRDLSATAVKLTVLCALRTSEVIGGYWEEIDLDEEVWTIPASRMKAGRQHRVPLSKAALHTLRCLKAESKSGLLFPGRSIGRPLSNMAMLQKIRGMDEKSLASDGPGWRNEAGEVITMHGFRSSFRDWAAETTNFANIVPEMALAHKISNATEAAYRRGDLLEKRKQLMEEWARYALSGCKTTL